MAITISASVTAPGYLEPVLVTVAGASASTDYILTIGLPSGWRTDAELHTDGSGGATYKFTPQHSGTPTFDLRPKAEFTGTTTAAKTATPIRVAK
jgi:hypothetical protein